MPLSRAISGFRHALGQTARFKDKFPEYLEEFSHVEASVLSSQKEIESWLESLRLKMGEQAVPPKSDRAGG